PDRLPRLRIRDRGRVRGCDRRAAAGASGSGRTRSRAERENLRRQALNPFGQAALALQLVEMRLERERGRRAQLAGRVVPDVVEQLIARSEAPLERVGEPALAIEPVLEIFGQLLLRLPNDWPVARTE